MNAQHLPPETLNAWLAAASAELGLGGDEAPIGRILEVAADVAHGVARPAAPLSTFLLGLALGRGEADGQTFETLAQRLSGLARDWDAGRSDSADRAQRAER